MAVPRLTRRLGSRVKACGRNADGDGDGCSGRLALRRDGTVTRRRRRRRRRRRGRQRRTSLAASRLLAHDAYAFVSLAGKPPRTTHDGHDDLARSFKSDGTHSTYSRRSFSLPPILSMYQSLSFSCFLSLARSLTPSFSLAGFFPRASGPPAIPADSARFLPRSDPPSWRSSSRRDLALVSSCHVNRAPDVSGTHSRRIRVSEHSLSLSLTL